MIKSNHCVNSSSFLFAIMLVSTTFLLLGVVFLGMTIIPSSSSSNSQINNILGHAQSNPNMAFAQSSVATFANSASSSNDSLVFNNYENSEMGISIKYPSNFLIDESNSNETVKQVSFFPAYDDSSDYPQTYISWFDVYVEELYPPISDSGNPINISSYLEDQANLIQEQDADVTIVESSTDSMLSGFPAYELVTRSYSGNTSIDDIEIGTIVGNKLYLLNYEVNTSEVQDALPIANKMIYSFKINPMNNLADSITKLANSSSIAEIKEKAPFLESLFSSINMKNLTNNPYSLLSALGLNDTTLSSLESLIANSTLPPSSTGSFPSSNLSSLMGSGFGSINSETLCSIEILSSLCRGDIFANHSLTPFLTNNGSLSGNGNALSQLFNLSNSTSGLLGGGSLAGAGAAVGEGFNLSDLRNLLGPFAMLSSPSSNGSSSSFPFLDNGSNSFFGQSGLESSLFSSSPTGNISDTMLLDHLFSNGGFNNNSNISQSGMENDLSFNPFAAIFETNSTGTGHQLMENNSSLDSNGTNQINNNNNNNSATLDLMKILEFLQNKQQQ